MMRWSIPVVVVFLLAGLAAADGIGTYAPVTDRRIDGLSTTFRIGVLNLEAGPRQVRLRVEGAANVSVDVPSRAVRLRPAEVTTDPSGEGWFHLGEGRYAKPAFIPVDARINASRYDRNVSFTVAVVTTAVAERRSGLRQRVVQSRQHTFTVASTSPRLAPDEDEDDLFRTDGDEVVNTTPQDPGTADGRRPGPRQKNITGDDQVPDRDGGVNTVTAVLVAAILVVAGSILREVV